MTVQDNSLPSLDGPHTHTVSVALRTAGEVIQERFVVPSAQGHGVASREGFRIPESDGLAEQDTLPVDQLERSSW
jgi:hypothetical protein